MKKINYILCLRVTATILILFCHIFSSSDVLLLTMSGQIMNIGV